jgi:hypothetical protein
MPPGPSNRVFNQLVSAAPDLTFALNNFTFDFTIWKSTPPMEYSGLGDALSRRRKVAAEDGEEHVIARKLGGLFHNFLPEVPALISAYGQRVSRIASAYPRKAKGSHAPGIFTEYAGFDGTSIWAAATSSKEGICLHLLACMLARLWEAPEAISIWWEVVQQRKADLATLDPDDPLHLVQVGASRIELSRDDLAKWDASARAWLDIADQAMKKEQTRLLLLVDKTKLPIDVTPGVYHSVTNAWKRALTTVNKIIEGMSYAVEDGAAVLGLASWHLFPKMYVLRQESTRYIEQDDAVIPRAGVVTFGIEGSASGEGDRFHDGVRWSLPLAHLRYYGEPVLSKTNMGTNSLRLQRQEFNLVVLGSFLSRWGPQPLDIGVAASLISGMWEFLCTMSETHAKSRPLPNSDGIDEFLADLEMLRFPSCNSWFKLLADAAGDLLSSEGLEREAKECLVERGQRRHDLFLTHEPLSIGPFLGLGTLERLLGVLHEEGVIHVLRAYVKLSGLNHQDVVIRYTHRHHPFRGRVKGAVGPDSETAARKRRFDDNQGEGVAKRTKIVATPHKVDSFREWPVPLYDSTLTYPSLFPVLETAAEDNLPPSEEERGESPALEVTPSTDPLWRLEFPDELCPIIDESTATARPETIDEIQSKLLMSDNMAECYEFASALPAPTHPDDNFSSGHTRWLHSSLDQETRRAELLARGETVQYFDQEQIQRADQRSFLWQGRDGADDDSFAFLFGDPAIGAVFHRVGSSKMEEEALSPDVIREAFEAHAVHPRKFLHHLASLEHHREIRLGDKPSDLVNSLRGIAAISALYKLMPHATMAANTFEESLDDAKWLIATKQQSNAKAQNITFNITVMTPLLVGLWIPESRQSKDEVYIHFRDNLLAHELDRPSAFACIARLEIPACNMRPSEIGEVMALSVANSIYVAMPLLCDPFEEPTSSEIKHVVGNIGRPGLSFLVPPPNPKVKKQPNVDLVRHRPFDGTLGVDKYSSTSMHLSFTRSAVPIALSQEGAQDVEAHFRQAVVSLHGNDGQWVADLDILDALNHVHFRRMKDPDRFECTHSDERKAKPGCMLKSIDNWDEYLDRPKVPGVVRTSGNWLARLAAATLNVQRGFPVLVLPRHDDSEKQQKVCWACAIDQGWKAKADPNSYNAAELPYFIA